MERTPVQSSNLASIGYEPDTSMLEIEFLTGSIYQYFGVPQAVYEELMNASSKGSYFYHQVREAGYSYVKIA